MRSSFVWACAAFGLLLTAPRAAFANGRYPFAQQALLDPSDPKRLWLRTTYGIFTSPDAGKSWFWICDAAIGYQQFEDPMMAVAANGSVFAGVAEGLFSSSDHGCTWPSIPDVGEARVADLTTTDAATHLLALTITVLPNGDYDTTIFGSSRADGGVGGLSPLGPPIANDMISTTIDGAPSDDRRIYVAGALLSGADGGATPDRGVLLRSRDGGTTWERKSIAGTADGEPYIAAVDPTNPDALYVRVQGDSDGRDAVQSWLLYSSDAGDHFTEVFRGDADMLGFALSNDGQTVFAGLGDTHDPNRVVDAAALGLYRANTVDHHFTRVFHGQVGCLMESDAGLYVCGQASATGFELGISRDTGATITPVLTSGGVNGPLSCGAETAQATQCAPYWAESCSPIASCPQVDAGTPVVAESTGGCGCSSPSQRKQQPEIGMVQLRLLPDWAAPVAPLAFFVAAAARRIRRHRRRRSPPG